MLLRGVREKIGSHKKDVCLAVGLFVLAVVPRVLQLDVFLTPDEPVWIEGAVRFFQALLSREYAHAYHIDSPGITTMWVAGLGLIAKYLTRSWAPSGGAASFWAFLQSVPLHPIDVNFLFALRLPIALITSCTVVGAYLLVKEMFDRKVAVLSAIVIALDPFYMAHSRLILLDALVTSFMLLSILGFITYLKGRRSLGCVIFSGIAGGLAFLTKSPSLFLAPFMLFLALATNLLSISGSTRMFPRRAYRGFLILGIWAVTALLIYFLLWPAMWVDPIGMVSRTIDKAVTHAGASELKGNFFLGRNELDPGLLFYPVHLLFRMTPLTLLGTAASLALLVGKSEKKLDILLLLAYVFLYMAFMTMGSTKAERYLLPVFPAVDILAAVGLCGLAKEVWQMSGPASWHANLKGSSRLMVGLLAVLLLQAGFSLPYHPYYFSSHNPLMGGTIQVPQVLLVGWGEGLDKAARYINEKKDAKALKVATFYREQVFSPFSDSATKPFTAQSIFWNDIDYVVLYISQVQRKSFPFSGGSQTVDFFLSLQPEHTVRINGIEYAWIYKVPKPLPNSFHSYQHFKPFEFGDKILFRGYDLYDDRIEEEGKLSVNLYWQALREMEEDYTIYLKLVNNAYHIWGQQEGRPYWGGLPTNRWGKGQVVGDKREIDILPGTPPGEYHIEITLYDLHNGQALEASDQGRLLLGPVEVPRQVSLDIASLAIEHPWRVEMGGKVRLLGYNIESGFRPGDGIHLTLFWQCLESMDQDYAVFTHLVDEDKRIWGQKDNQPVDGFYPTTGWEPGEIVRDQYDLVISPDAPPGYYRLEIGMYLAETGERLAALKDGVPLPGNRILLQSVAVGGIE
ncbi:MAG: phospholipid carrier-dependent glycosyltransferase [Anaerolineales bacterium]|nr:MAG: phospholipid carrier-dependent glycosyltransferase [Anaerolineales bacterium]